MAVILLSGQMAGMGVLNLPNSMIGTGCPSEQLEMRNIGSFPGPAGFVLIVYFTYNAIFVGQRLGLCWTMVENLFPEYKNQCRDPYMVIAEKAADPTARHIVSFCISITLFGVACVVIVLLGSFFENIFQTFHLNLSHCVWMVILTALLTPICWLGTPKDFW